MVRYIFAYAKTLTMSGSKLFLEKDIAGKHLEDNAPSPLTLSVCAAWYMRSKCIEWVRAVNNLLSLAQPGTKTLFVPGKKIVIGF